MVNWEATFIVCYSMLSALIEGGENGKTKDRMD